MAEADDLYWASLVERPGASSSVALDRYRAVQKRAFAGGYVYTPVTELVETAGLQELLERVMAVRQGSQKTEEMDAEALLGAVEPVSIPISEAFDVYCRELAITDQLGKSDE